MTTQKERVKLVLERLQDFIVDEDDAENISDFLDEMLDDMRENDFFGTESQCDPRGDFREEEWTIWFVQGLDES